MPTKASDVAREFESIVSRMEAEMQSLADRVREELVVPLCRKKGWKFYAGMGEWTFYDKRGFPVEEKRIPPGIVSILDGNAIRLEQTLGEWMNPVD